MTLVRDLLPDDACTAPREWLGLRRSPSKAWAECPRGDWMLWLLARRGVDRRQLVLAACDCARLALVHVPDGEDRPRLAIEAAEGWARGEVDIAAVREASAASAASAAYAASAASAAYAAYAASAAAAAAYAASAAAVYVASAAYDAVQLQCADLVRTRFPEHP